MRRRILCYGREGRRDCFCPFGSGSETVIAIYALNKLGATANTIDPRMDVQTIKKMVMESDSRFMLVLDLAYSKVRQIKKEIEQEHIIVQPTYRSLPFIKKVYKSFTDNIPVSYSYTVISWDDFLKKAEVRTRRKRHIKGMQPLLSLTQAAQRDFLKEL